MRLIINTRVFSSLNYKALSENQKDSLFSIAEYIFQNNSEKVDGNIKLLSTLTGLSKEEVKEMEELGFFNVSEGVITWTNTSISYFKNNNENVKRCIEKKKTQPNKIEEKPSIIQDEEKLKKSIEYIDWDRIIESFNNTFKDYQYVSLIQGMTDKRKQSVKKVFDYANKKQKDPQTGELYSKLYNYNDIYSFCEWYFDGISELNGVKKSWLNQGGTKMFQFDFDFFFSMEKYINITEKGKYA